MGEIARGVRVKLRSVAWTASRWLLRRLWGVWHWVWRRTGRDIRLKPWCLDDGAMVRHGVLVT